MIDAFISYSHLDSKWAEKLHADLVQRDFKVFLDTKRLVAGTDWEESLLQQLDGSRHLILRWSNQNAAASKWVTAEASLFRHLIFQDEKKGLPYNNTFAN